MTVGSGERKGARQLRMRDVSFIKPKGYENYLTITELARKLRKDQTWLRRLEKANRIPKAKRVAHGNIEGGVRLWSPSQVDEITIIIKGLKPGRPKNA